MIFMSLRDIQFDRSFWMSSLSKMKQSLPNMLTLTTTADNRTCKTINGLKERWKKVKLIKISIKINMLGILFQNFKRKVTNGRDYTQNLTLVTVLLNSQTLYFFNTLWQSFHFCIFQFAFKEKTKKKRSLFDCFFFSLSLSLSLSFK